MRKFLLLCLFTTLLLMAGIAQSKKQDATKGSDNNSLQVRTVNGIVEGVLEKSGVRSFKGIPFAAPPVGAMRWREPQPVQNWQGVRKANQFGPRAMQAPIFGDMNFRSNGMSEDCLYLNVWASTRKGKELLPVLVYFYGGGFVAGDGSEPRYDGESMAQKGILALTVNYRLGVFGFLSHPELTKESPHHASGNYGLLDQAAALQWVQQNIAAFGGDPKKVTIAGESAGSISVSAQMASPLSKNLIAGAIGESGSLLGTLSAVPLSEGEQVGVQFAKSINANSLAELREMNADSLLKASTKQDPFRFPRTIDGYFFPKNPYAIFEAGEQARVPLLVGWNSEEMNYKAILGNESPTKENFAKAVQRLYGSQAEEVLKLYNPATEEEVERIATGLAGDRFIAFSTWKWSDVHNKTAGKPVYRYLYERPRPAMRPEMGNASAGLAGGVQLNTTAAPAPPAKGAVHSAEIEYAMGNLSTNKVYAWTEDDYKVSRIMQEYFANFIKTGNPNGAGLSEWPAVNTSNPVPVMHIDVHTRVEPEKYRERYLFMERAAK
ncbi:carboxylesterase family protein [Chitinophagaceae bacterium LB-8]|uniref:Carboxylic ester hydrolase n=1 Tax=Paraflavisolibacter caeni TaxID=2982496 RepID=A0A9X3BJX0_9BACT|nr:carboxylesterase family protein [Paraflavisolibacter caeni]MCU7551738.1 carboxylesterase family protein [Paraflavisolibacter caeni]